MFAIVFGLCEDGNVIYCSTREVLKDAGRASTNDSGEKNLRSREAKLEVKQWQEVSPGGVSTSSGTCLVAIGVEVVHRK